eukprot:7562303-Heterocapsa_arctica.AAC.1
MARPAAHRSAQPSRSGAAAPSRGARSAIMARRASQNHRPRQPELAPRARNSWRRTSGRLCQPLGPAAPRHE